MSNKEKIVLFLISAIKLKAYLFGYLFFILPLFSRVLFLKLMIRISHMLPSKIGNYVYLFNEYFSRIIFKFKKDEYFVIKKILKNTKIRLDITKKTQRMIFLKKEYESEIVSFLERELKGAKVFLDIGANIGYFTLIAKEINPNIKVFSFEPEEKNLEYLEYNISLNNLGDVIVKEVALSNFSGEETLFINPKNEGGHSLVENKKYKEQKVVIEKLDNLMTNIKVDIAKIDVEGFEFNVMKGGIKTLMENRDIKIVSELSRDFDEIKNITRENNKNIYFLDSDGSQRKCLDGEILPFANYLIK